MLTPSGPGQSPGSLQPGPQKRWLGPRINRVPAIAFMVIVGCVLGAVAYTLKVAHERQERTVQLHQAQPAPADASTALKGAPSGFIERPGYKPAAYPIVKPIESKPAAPPEKPPPPDDNGREDARKAAWRKYWANWQQVRDDRFERRHKALSAKTAVELDQNSGEAPAGAGRASSAAAPAATPVSASAGPQNGLNGYAGWAGYGGFPGGGGFFPGLGPAPQIDTEAQQQKIDFANQQGDLGKNDVVPTVHHPAIPNALMAGSYIKVVSENEINSDVPGSALGRVTESVYDTAGGHCVLVPAGSKVIGHYNSQVSAGQSRLPGVMTRIIFPDGSSQAIGAMEAADNGGSAGWQDQIDRHLIEKFSSAFIAGLFGASIQLSVPHNATYNNGYNAQQVIGASLGQQMGQLGQQIAQQNLSIPNTITIRAGYEYTIITDKDILMKPWSCDGRHIHQSLPIMNVSDQ